MKTKFGIRIDKHNTGGDLVREYHWYSTEEARDQALEYWVNKTQGSMWYPLPIDKKGKTFFLFGRRTKR